MTVYLLTHPDPAFRGVVLGVDFVDGRGSTSSVRDAVLLVREGCRIADREARAEVKSHAQTMARMRRQREAEIQRQREFEQTPEYTASALRRKAEREAAEKRAAQRRPKFYR